MDTLGASSQTKRMDVSQMHQSRSPSPRTVAACINTVGHCQSERACASLTSLATSSPSVVSDLINIHLSVTDAHSLLTTTTIAMTTKPLDLSVDGHSPVTLETHSLLGASISSSHGVPNSSADSMEDGINQYSSLFPVDVTADHHQNPFNTAAAAPTVPLQTNLRPKLQHNNNNNNNNNRANYVCKWNMCGQKFVELEDLVTHVNERHVILVESEYSCKWEGCSRKGKGFNARYKMLIHVRTHTNEKPHQCPICNKSFSRLENLKIHNRSHTGERPYVCPVAGCNKRYSNSSDRFKHTRTHLEEKPYFCKIAGCDKRYTDPSSLRKHVKTFGHYANRDHLNHYISQKPSQQPIAPPTSQLTARIVPPLPLLPPPSSTIPKTPVPTAIFPGVTQSPPTSNITGLPEGVIVYPILVHSPTLQPHYSYVTLPGHLAANTSATFSVAGLQNNNANSATKDGSESVRPVGFGLNQDTVGQRNGTLDIKNKNMMRS